MTDAREVLRYLAWPIGDQQTELWRWFSPALVHFSLSHIGFNLALWWFGWAVERKLGTGKLFTILLVSALFSNWGSRCLVKTTLAAYLVSSMPLSAMCG